MIRNLAPVPHEERRTAAPPADASRVDPASGAADAAFAELQELLLSHQRTRIVELNTHLNQLSNTVQAVEHEIRLLNDIELLADKIKPSLAPAISASVRESRDELIEALSPIIARLITTSIENSREGMVQALLPIIDRLISTSVRESSDNMVDALYPIIGRLVSRSVAESLRDLVRRIDDQMRSAFDFRLMVRRAQARILGIPEAEFTLRAAMPFQVLQIFLIHRETGLLVRVLAQDPELTTDSDIISGMLTAIRDFAQDAIGQGQGGDLDEVQYGDKRILIETTRYVYIALVTQGIEPLGFRGQVRERLMEIEQAYLGLLRNYDGNAAPLAAAENMLRPLLIQEMTLNGASPLNAPPHTVLLVRHGAPHQLTPVVRLTFALVLFTFLLSLWRVWQIWSQTPLETSALVGHLLQIWWIPW
ncbi:MAG TPA: hypothetical protein PKE45_01435 [Caldilineaceae bacterium]|nr:hypothetical protein [Caldilineaceae bacterium]